MSKHDELKRSNVSAKGQSKRVGTSVLVAAASLLGTSLGVLGCRGSRTKGNCYDAPHLGQASCHG